MPQPYDYGSIMRSGQSLIPDLFQQMMVRREMEQRGGMQALQQAKQQRELEEQAAYKRDLDAALLDGSPQAIQRLMMRYPEMADNIKPAFEAMAEDQRAGDLTQVGTVYARGQAGDIAGAAEVLRQRIEADRAAGQSDPADEAVLAGLESDDPIQVRAALATVGIHLAALTGDKFAETYGKLNPADAKTAPQREYEWRVGQFGQEAADRWLASQNITSAEPGATIYNREDFVGGGGTAPAQPRGGDQSTGAQPPIAPVVPGNLSTAVRYNVQNPDGTNSTVRTISIGTDQGEVLIPTVVGGRVVSDDEAVAHYRQTGENFGTFRNPAEATTYAQWLHRQHESQTRGSSGYAMPVEGGTFTSGYGDSRDGGTRSHNGQDIAAPAGTSVRPIAPGKVVAVGEDPRSGLFVRVKHPDGSISSYAHLGRQDVQVGADVGPATPLGVVGATGNATGNVLHLVIRDRNGRAVDPRPLLGGAAQVRTRQEYDRLPAGTTYIAPDGSQRVKG